MDEVMAWLKIMPAMTKNNILRSAIGWIFGLVCVGMIIIEFLPVIKLHPISSMLKWIGGKVNKDVMTQVDSLKNTVDGIKKENAERYAIGCRSRILQFGDEIRQGSRHSKESFDQILEYIDTYDKYCAQHPDFKNNKTCLTTKKILETYAKCMDEDDFL